MNSKLQVVTNDTKDKGDSRRFEVRIIGVGPIVMVWWFNGLSYGERAKPHLDMVGQREIFLANAEVLPEAFQLAVDKMREWQLEYEKETGQMTVVS